MVAAGRGGGSKVGNLASSQAFLFSPPLGLFKSSVAGHTSAHLVLVRIEGKKEVVGGGET